MVIASYWAELYAVIDEPEFTDQSFFLSALIVRQPAPKLLEDDPDGLLNNLPQTTGTPRSGELHGHDVTQQRVEWKTPSSV